MNPQLSSHLIRAVRTGNTSTARVVLNKDADPNTADDTGCPVFLASIRAMPQQNGLDLAMPTLLLEAGADVDGQDSTGMTALMHAAKWADDTLMEFLLERGAGIAKIDFEGNTPLMHAAFYPLDYHTVDVLVGAGADLNARNALNESVLMRESDRGDLNFVRYLLRCGATVDFEATHPVLALVCAIVGEDLSTTQRLAPEHANGRGSRGRTPLEVGLLTNSVAMTQLLLHCGADANLIGEIDLPIVTAINADSPELVALLIASGANLNVRDRIARSSLVSLAKWRECPDIMELLKANGAPED